MLFVRGHDAWYVRALGKSTLNCYTALLSAASMTVAELVAATGRTAPTVRRALTKLEFEGMAASDGKCWHALETNAERLDNIAARHGTSGKSARKKAQHQMEREKKASQMLFEQKHAW